MHLIYERRIWRSIMTTTLEWPEIVLRLTLTLLAGIVLGCNRTERGRAAGLRTTVLVSLAAAMSMIQVNLLLPLRGKETDSFSSLDLMRLPLGVLTGMGFIGAGAILRKGNSIQGVTTAATLWITTAIGLCFGGGQISLGVVGLGVAIAALWGFQRIEDALRRDRRAILALRIRGESLGEAVVRDAILAAKFEIEAWEITRRTVSNGRVITIRGELRWHGHRNEMQPPPFLQQFEENPAIVALRWRA
jgi:putative Mg2+ transporter-C (MgtC) family protein